jgi:hypothetical protein
MTLIGEALFVVATTDEFGSEIWTANLTPAVTGDYNGDGMRANRSLRRARLAEGGRDRA